MRYEIRRDTRFLSTGTIAQVLPDAVVLSARERIEVNGPEKLTLAVPSTLDTELTGDRVVNVVDGSTSREWRISKLTRGRSVSGVTTTAECLGIRSDLQRFSPIVTQQQANGDRWTHVEWVGLSSTQLWEAVWNCFDDDTDSVSYFAKGACPSSTRLHDFVLDWETQGSALTELATVLGYEVDVRAASTGYVVNLSTGLNSTLDPPLIAFRKNQRGLRFVEDHGKKATRIYPRALGDDAFKPTIGDLMAQVTNGTTSGTIDIGTYEADQLKGLYLELVGDSTRRLEITGSSTLSESVTTISYSSAAGAAYFPSVIPFSSALGAGEIYHFLRDSSTGQRLVYVPRSTSAGKLQSVVLDRRDIPAITNMLIGGANPGSADMPVFAVSSGASQSNVSGPSPFVHLGERSRKITLPAEGDSVTFAGWLVGGVSQQRPHLSMQTNFYLESGRVGVSFRVHSEAESLSILFPQTTAGGSTLARATAVGRWHDLAIAPGAFNYYDAIPSNFSFVERGFLIGDVKFESITSTGATVAYVDSIQTVNEAVPAEQIVDGSAARKLWNASIDELRSGIGDPARLFDVDAVDLGRLSTADYPGDAFKHGQRVKLFDPGIGVDVTRRIRALTRDLKAEGNTVLELFDES